MSYVTVVMQSRFSVFDMSLEEAALDLGAKPLKTFLVITLPIVAPAVVSGWLLAFTISLDDLVITLYNNGPGSGTLPQLIFSKVRRGVDPTINALGDHDHHGGRDRRHHLAYPDDAQRKTAAAGYPGGLAGEQIIARPKRKAAPLYQAARFFFRRAVANRRRAWLPSRCSRSISRQVAAGSGLP